MIVLYLLIAMLGAAVGIFTLQNPEPIAMNFFHWRSGQLPLSLLMLFSALAGVLFTALSGFAQQLQLYRRIRYLEQRLAEERRFAEVFEPPPPSPARVEAARERMPERMRVSGTTSGQPAAP
jgi:uncharacterized integral membrane protein